MNARSTPKLRWAGRRKNEPHSHLCDSEGIYWCFDKLPTLRLCLWRTSAPVCLCQTAVIHFAEKWGEAIARIDKRLKVIPLRLTSLNKPFKMPSISD